MSIECLVAITNLLVDKTKNSLECKSSPRVILQLTDLLCSSYLSEPSTSTLRYLTCLYHIAHYMLEKVNTEYYQIAYVDLTLHCKLQSNIFSR